MTKTKPPYSPEFRQQMVELVHSGRHTICSCAEYTRQEEVTLEAFWAEWMI